MFINLRYVQGVVIVKVPESIRSPRRLGMVVVPLGFGRWCAVLELGTVCYRFCCCYRLVRFWVMVRCVGIRNSLLPVPSSLLSSLAIDMESWILGLISTDSVNVFGVGRYYLAINTES